MKKIKMYHTGIYYFSDKLRKKMKELFKYPCTLIEAPMGYGKTTAIREFLRNSDTKVFWQRIYDNSVSGFWNSFCHLFDEIDSCYADRFQSIGFPCDSTSREEVLGVLQSINFTEETVIVMDDYHFIDSLEVKRLIEYIIQNELNNLHIVLTARFSNIENQEELMLKGYLLYINKELLEFGPNEIISYYRICGINLKEDEVNRILRYTEGWVSALYLMMLEFKEEGCFTISMNITKLIEKSVYMSFPDELKEFLVMVSVFDHFTAEQALFLWKKENVGVLLSELVTKNAFINYDENQKTYQIHNILSEFLHDIFDLKTEEYKMGVYQRVAKWYRNTDDYIKAMNYYYRLGDFNGLLETLEQGKGHNVFYEHKADMIKFYRECSGEIKCQHPIGLLVYAMCFFTFNEMELFAEVCGQFEKAIQNENAWDSKTLQMLMGEFELLQSFTKYNDINKMLLHIKNSWEFLKQPAKFIDCKESWTFGAPSVLYMFHREAGKLEKEIHDIKEALPIYNKLTDGHGKGGDNIMEAEWYFNCGDFDNAEILAYHAYNQAKSANQNDIILCVCFLQVRIGMAKGEGSSAMEAYLKFKEELRENQWSNLHHTIHLCEAFILACLHQEKSIPTWIKEGDFLTSKLYFPTIAFLNIVYGRTLLLEGEYHKLLGISQQFMETAAVFPNLLGTIYTHIYIAAANDKLMRREIALTALHKALEIAIPDRLYMPFVENGDFIKPLLEVLYHNDANRHIATILKLEESYHRKVVQITETYYSKAKPKLSEREMEISRLVAEGMSNSEIGARLFISQNTVKTLLKRIFEKLEINSRSMLKLYIEKEI